MTDRDEFSERELEIIERTSLMEQSAPDLHDISERTSRQSPHLFDGVSGWDEFFTLPLEEQIAGHIAHQRYIENELNLPPEAHYFLLMLKHINVGISIIKDADNFYRFQPCIERIFELDENQLIKLFQYCQSFVHSDYYTVHIQTAASFFDDFVEWDSEELSPENIRLGFELYSHILGIYERGLPNLLAMKRILDGESPENHVLQRKDLSSIYRELTETKANPNSVYFDLIVRKFNRDIRNGIAHGDILHNPAETEIRIPSRDKCYSYKDFNSILEENVSNGLFLSDIFLRLVQFQYMAMEGETNGRDLLRM